MGARFTPIRTFEKIWRKGLFIAAGLNEKWEVQELMLYDFENIFAEKIVFCSINFYLY
jgi:hypothetical protein